MSEKPNILFLMTDQHRFDWMGVMNSVLKTPNLDRLAAQGTEKGHNMQTFTRLIKLILLIRTVRV